MRGQALAGLLVVLAGCSAPQAPLEAPADLVGEWVDDYGIRYQVSDSAWRQEPGAVYLVTRWDSVAGFLVARNHDANPSNAGLYTRIDWLRLADSAPWEWAFCLATWDANSAEGAAMAPAVDREHPRTGCAGHPFSRMRRVPADSAGLSGRGYP